MGRSHHTPRFQTLIGTVKSGGPEPHLRLHPLRVSNPHRYGQKRRGRAVGGGCERRFKPS